MPRDLSSGERPGGLPPQADMEETVSFGDVLRRERLKSQRTLAEESKATGVPGVYLEALEENEFDRLPPAIYVRGYLSTFARAHDLLPEELWARFEVACRAHRREQNESPETIFGLFSPPGEKFHWRDWSVPMGLAAAVIAYSILSPLLPGEHSSGSRSDAPGVTVQPSLPSDPLPPPRQEPAPPVMREAAVRVVLSAEAVTRVSAALDGGEMEEWTLQAGETRHLAASREIVVSLGNAGAVRLNYNDKELGFIGGKGEVKRNVRFVAGRDQ